MLIRFFFNRSGEIFTIIVCLAIGFYLATSLSGSLKILDNEKTACAVVEKIYRLEREAFRTSLEKRYLPLSKIKDRSPSLSGLRDCLKSHTGESGSELFTDGRYLYFMRLEYKPHSASDYISGETDEQPSGFKLLAWPVLFTSTGEMAFYVDQRGKLAASNNGSGLYDGTKSFPPDLQPPNAIVENTVKDIRQSNWWVKSDL